MLALADTAGLIGPVLAVLTAAGAVAGWMYARWRHIRSEPARKRKTEVDTAKTLVDSAALMAEKLTSASSGAIDIMADSLREQRLLVGELRERTKALEVQMSTASAQHQECLAREQSHQAEIDTLKHELSALKTTLGGRRATDAAQGG